MQFLCILLSFVVKMNFNRIRYTTKYARLVQFGVVSAKIRRMMPG